MTTPDINQVPDIGDICWCDGEPSCHYKNDGRPDGLCRHCRLLGHGSLLTSLIRGGAE